MLVYALLTVLLTCLHIPGYIVKMHVTLRVCDALVLRRTLPVCGSVVV